MVEAHKGKKKVSCKVPLIKTAKGKIRCPPKTTKFWSKTAGKACCTRGRASTVEGMKRPPSAYAAFVKYAWANDRASVMEGVPLLYKKVEYNTPKQYKQAQSDRMKAIAANIKVMWAAEDQAGWKADAEQKLAAFHAKHGMGVGQRCPISRRVAKGSTCKSGAKAVAVGSKWCCPVPKKVNAYAAFVKAYWTDKGAELKERLAEAVDRKKVFGEIQKEISAAYKSGPGLVQRKEAKVDVAPGVYSFKEFRKLFPRMTKGKYAILLQTLKEDGTIARIPGKAEYNVNVGFRQEGAGFFGKLFQKQQGAGKQGAGKQVDLAMALKQGAGKQVDLAMALKQLQEFTQQQE